MTKDNNTKPDHNKPDHNKPDQNKPDQNKPDQNKPDQNKSGHKKTEHQKTEVIGATPTSVTTAGGFEVRTKPKGGAARVISQQSSPARIADSMIMSGANITVKTLLEAGAHFGHQTQRWNPRMAPYIFGDRNGIHIINLDATVKLWERARKQVVETIAAGGTIMFVGTKQTCRELVQEEANRCGAFFVTDRWLGGTMSNFTTIRSAIERMNKLEELVKSAEQENSKVRIVKKERVRIHKELDKLQKSLGGIRDMKRLPQLMFIVDLVKEEIAVAEARKLNIPVVGIADTNSDPSRIAFPIPCNDDAPKVCRLLAAAIADAVIEGKRLQTNDGSNQYGANNARSNARSTDVARGRKGQTGGGRRGDSRGPDSRGGRGDSRSAGNSGGGRGELINGGNTNTAPNNTAAGNSGTDNSGTVAPEAQNEGVEAVEPAGVEVAPA